MYMVLVVIDDPSRLDKVLEGLKAGGITGATLIESTGLHRKQKKHIPMPYLYSGDEPGEVDNLTLFTVVPDRKTAEKCLTIIENIVGDLNNPNTGIFAAWELDLVKGISPLVSSEGKE